VSELLGEHVLDGGRRDVGVRVLELRRQLAVWGLERGVRL
jgi:hypothetical protein